MSETYSHLSVLPDEIVGYAPTNCHRILDCTLGGAGHSLKLLKAFPEAILTGADRDPAALEAAAQTLKPVEQRVQLLHCAFSHLDDLLSPDVLFDYIIADIGVSSPQLDQADRGFSFLYEGPLDMRMDPSTQKITAAELVRTLSEEALARIFFQWGEEPMSRRIARAIVQERQQTPITTTSHLAALTAAAVPKKFHKKGFHPATLTFQALRIAVNQELNELESLLRTMIKYLDLYGRLAIISFHSLEDRIVKNHFRSWENPCQCPSSLPYCVCGKKPLGRTLSKKPVTASAVEQKLNSRSRSAKLRIFERTLEHLPDLTAFSYD
ncbi:MAG: 16S rRNA (cytosine(1402)-N(4))-methyltransferase RsmH [SAR324 cluster bacterium]|nr:16S rRNA (cytosine(1402)-N(4))-methyltransferase RsmH [SAR324 cluster bacterium]